MVLHIIRWLATVAALWNGAFLAYEGLWLWPRTVGIDSPLDSTLLLVACFLPIVGAGLAVFRPRPGSLLMIAAVGVYGLLGAISILEQVAKREALGWNWGSIYMFVVPTSVFAITIYLSSRRKRRELRDVAH